ncbi:AAA family ATPase [Leifsonia aquatica]|uniref:UDP-N-acetylglucosamine kinase n=2 Tax=Leifsonia aquatica TaxID=144185 RepID=U2SVG3_LEIAQ|nr:AAA family ATPase [Leifsonia aquatica]ERK69303.1 hypothetical protein N136_04381 [Leifsonia aquatica ATCC 14665]MBB2966950.1 putative kinase [Leifsonia aquatica]
MARLILINGAPASGKSTLAALLVEDRPLALALDIDSVRGALGRWSDDPEASGTAARRIALAMIDAHLTAGHDVVVPQFLRRPEFADELAAAAHAAQAGFVEIVLVGDPAEASARFAARSASDDPRHRDAAVLQRLPAAEPIEALYADLLAMAEQRPGVHFVPTVDGEPERALQAIRSILHDS